MLGFRQMVASVASTPRDETAGAHADPPAGAKPRSAAEEKSRRIDVNLSSRASRSGRACARMHHAWARSALHASALTRGACPLNPFQTRSPPRNAAQGAVGAEKRHQLDSRKLGSRTRHAQHRNRGQTLGADGPGAALRTFSALAYWQSQAACAESANSSHRSHAVRGALSLPRVACRPCLLTC